LARLRVPSRPGWRWLVPVICLLAGLLLATSHHVSRGTELRSPQSASLVGSVRAAEARVAAESDELTGLQAEVRAATNQAGKDNAAVAAAQAEAAPLQTPSGLSAVRGPGILVVLDDAHSVP